MKEFISTWTVSIVWVTVTGAVGAVWQTGWFPW